MFSSIKQSITNITKKELLYYLRLFMCCCCCCSVVLWINFLLFPLSNTIGRDSWDILGPQALIGFSFDGGCQVCVKLPHLYNKLRNYFCTFSFCGAPFEIGNIRFCVQKYFIYIILKNYPVC